MQASLNGENPVNHSQEVCFKLFHATVFEFKNILSASMPDLKINLIYQGLVFNAFRKLGVKKKLFRSTITLMFTEKQELVFVPHRLKRFY